MSRFVWLASYPKSGNTWTRAVLGAYLGGGLDDLGDLEKTTMASSRTLLDEHLPYASGDVPAAALDRLRPLVYEAVAKRPHDGPRLSKVHDACHDTGAGPLFPAAATQGAVVIVRDPRDICCSWAAFMATSLERSAGFLCNPEGHLAGSGKKSQTRQTMGSWSDHVASWLDAPFPIHLVRYEDLLADPVAGFSGVVRFIWGDVDGPRLEAAVEAARFERLRAKEDAEEHGFAERPAKAERFFRKGKAGSWQEELPPELAAKIVRHNGAMMERLGYDTGARRSTPLKEVGGVGGA
ncbi:MAG: sulfotransferase domain-containing protein [Thermoplasmatota archaeon]